MGGAANSQACLGSVQFRSPAKRRGSNGSGVNPARLCDKRHGSTCSWRRAQPWAVAALSRRRAASTRGAGVATRIGGHADSRGRGPCGGREAGRGTRPEGAVSGGGAGDVALSIRRAG